MIAFMHWDLLSMTTVTYFYFYIVLLMQTHQLSSLCLHSFLWMIKSTHYFTRSVEYKINCYYYFEVKPVFSVVTATWNAPSGKCHKWILEHIWKA